MAALAYVLLPLSGLLSFLLGSSARVRFHGLQAIALGALWPALLYLASAVSEQATRVVAVVGGVMWVALMVATALGRDVNLPLLGPRLRQLAKGENRT